MVVAGDIFDDSRPSYADFSLFVSGLERLNDAGIPVYFVTGNHDPFTSWDNSFSALPENAHLLGAGKPSFALYEREGCLLYTSVYRVASRWWFAVRRAESLKNGS